MRIIFFFLFFLCFTSIPDISAQTPQQQIQQEINNIKKQIAEQEKLIAEAKKNEEDPETIKAMEDELVQLKQQLAMMEKAGKSVSGIPTFMMNKAADQVNSETGNTTSIIPARKTALLDALPKRTLTEQELIAFLVAFHNELKQKLPPDLVRAALEIIDKFKTNYAKIAMTGVAAWYNHAPSESVILLTYAASKSPDDNTLNNCGAILNLYGREEKALPVLKYVLPHEPNNCTLLNNIGQAFAGLGEKDSAMFYFALVLKRCSKHPEANATAAYIAYSNGDTTLAANYMGQSLAGAYSEEHMDFYKNIRANAKPLIDPEINLTNKNYFIPNGFNPAPNCKNWDDCEIVTAKQEATKKQLAALREKYENIVIENSFPNTMKTHQDSLDWESGKGWKEGPFAKKAQYLKEVISAAYTEARQKATEELIERTTRITKNANQERMALDQEFEPQYKACEGVGGNCMENVEYKYCLAKKALDNKYFLELTDASQSFESVWYTKDVKYYNNLVFLTTFTAPNKHVLKAECATYTNFLLDQIRAYTLSECNPVGKPKCIEPPPVVPEVLPLPEFKEDDCAINIRIPFIVGHVSLNCERFEFEAGEGIIFKYEKNFKERESSFAIGTGIEAEIPGGIIDGSATALIGFKFDSNIETTDVFGAAKADVNVLGWGTSVISAGAKVGISSGFNSSFTVMGR
ncbi:MAG: hypothetical protein WBW16_11240 [Bacteroidota bacterium]